MPEIIEDLFDKFENGEVRLAERELTGDLETLGSEGEVVVTVSDLVSVESVVAVLVDGNESGVYSTVDETTNTNNIAAAKGYTDEADLDTADVTLEDNQVGVQFYDGSAAITPVGDVEPPNFKIIARGY